jgi:hypothetical protein
MEFDALIILVSFILGYGMDNFLASISKSIPSKKDRHFKFIMKRVRLHHNLLGYLVIILGFFYYPLILVSFGMGIIVAHKVRDELFWFIEGVDKDVKKIEKQIKEDKTSLRKNQIELKRKIQLDLKQLKKAFN